MSTSPSQLFNAAYANINMARELVCKMADVNVGNITHGNILKLLKLVRDGACAAQGLEVWRKKNPIPEGGE